MLSDSQILKRIETGDIRITYTFLPGQDGGFRQLAHSFRTPRDRQARNFFEEHLTRSRLALTLGPLVKPVSRQIGMSRRHFFAGHRGLVDLRKCPGGWVLLPNQSAVVYTNEHIQLPPDIVGLIIGRVSVYNNGLVTATSYLDSGWEGVAKLHLINTSRTPICLTLGMELARLFFHETPEATQDTSSVSRQGVHFGLTWTRILGDEIDPLPRSGSPKRARRRELVSQWSDLLQRYAGVGLLTFALAAIAAGFKVYTQVEHALSLGSQLNSVSRITTDLRQHSINSGVVTITIPSGHIEASTQVSLPASVLYRGAASFVLTSVSSPSDSNVFSSGDVQEKPSGSAAVQISVRLAHSIQQGVSVNVNWMYVP